MHSQRSVKDASQKQPVLYLLEHIKSLYLKKISLMSSCLGHCSAAEWSVEAAGPSICAAFGQPFTGLWGHSAPHATSHPRGSPMQSAKGFRKLQPSSHKWALGSRAAHPGVLCVVFSHIPPCFHEAEMQLCAEGVLEASGISPCLSGGSQAVIYLTHLCDFPLNSRVNGFLTSFKCTTSLSVAATFQPSRTKRTENATCP